MTSLAFSVICLAGSLPLAAEITNMEELLGQAGGEANRQTFQAKKELIARYCAADESGREAFAARLRTELMNPVRSIRIAAAECLSVRPTLSDIQPLLQALSVEDDAAVQAALARSTAMAISRLPRNVKGIVTTEAIGLFEQVVRSERTTPEARNVLIEMLGTLGPDALPRLQAFKADKKWGPILHSVLPASLAATGDPIAFMDIRDLYDSDSSEGFRVGCVHAMGALARKASAEDAGRVSTALGFLRLIALGNANPGVSSAACEAYAKWCGAVDDQEVFEAICVGVRVSSGDAQKNYLRALFTLKRPLDNQTTAYIQGLSESSTASPSHRKLAAAILARDDN